MVQYRHPWYEIGTSAQNLANELYREASLGHAMFGKKVIALAQRCDSDAVLFSIVGERRCAVVTLTWSGASEENIHWPETRIFESLDDWIHKVMLVDE